MSNTQRVDDPSVRSVNQTVTTPRAPAAYSAGRTSLVPFNGSQYNLQQQQAPRGEAPSRFAHLPMPVYQPGPSPPANHTSTPHAAYTQHPPVNQPTGGICGLEGCNVRLDDLSVGGQRRHLRDFHAAQFHSSRVRCTWVHEGGLTCGKKMDPASWGKHLASVHWRSTEEKCPHCPKSICRRDALKRHIDNHHKDQERI